jgi:hypothetical protein
MSTAIDTMPLTGTVKTVGNFKSWSAKLTSALKAIDSQWLVGDLWNTGKAVYGERAELLAEIDRLNFTVGTLDNYAATCAKFPESVRNERVRFTIHNILAPLYDRADIAEILAMAADQHWTATDARTAKAAIKSGTDPADLDLKAIAGGDDSESDDDADDSEPGTDVAPKTVVVDFAAMIAALESLTLGQVKQLRNKLNELIEG